MLVKETSAAKLFRGLLVDEYSPKDYKAYRKYLECARQFIPKTLLWSLIPV